MVGADRHGVAAVAEVARDDVVGLCKLTGMSANI